MQTSSWFNVDKATLETASLRLALLAALALAPLPLLAQAPAPEPAAAAAPAPAAQGTLDRVRSSGTLSLGYFVGAKPLSFQDSAGNADGYSVALCREIAAAVKSELGMSDLSVRFVPVAADAFDALKDGRIDLMCGPSQPTISRRAMASFSIPVYLGGTSALVRKDAAAALRAKLDGRAPPPTQPVWRGQPQIAGLGERKFVVVPGTASERWLKARLQELGVKSVVTTVPNLAAGVQAVASGGADALLADRSLLVDLVRNDPAGQYLVVGDRNVDFKTVSLAVRRNDEDFLLLVDKTLSRLYRSGKADAVYGKYLGTADASTREWLRRTAEPE
jgi:ABC-type amino acid transport substrate-binding protein